MGDMVLETEAGEVVAVGVRAGGIALTVQNENGRRVNLMTTRDAQRVRGMLDKAIRQEIEDNA